MFINLERLIEILSSDFFLEFFFYKERERKPDSTKQKLNIKCEIQFCLSPFQDWRYFISKLCQISNILYQSNILNKNISRLRKKIKF